MGDAVKVLHGVNDASCGVRLGPKSIWTVYANKNVDGEPVTGMCSVK